MRPDPDLPEPRETIRIAAWTAAGVGLGTGLFLALALAALYFFYKPHVAAVQPPVPSRFPEPRIQSDPAGDLRDFQAAQRSQLDGYAWVDRESGLARVPVSRAMEALAARGEAAWAPLEAPRPGIPLPVRPQAARVPEGGR